MTIIYTKQDIDRIRTIQAPKCTDRNRVSSSDNLRKNESTLLVNRFNNNLHTPRKRSSTKIKRFYSKNKFEKSVHLVGFIIRIYLDVWSPEIQIRKCNFPLTE